MLGIILFILKLIGIVLLCILGLILAIILVVLLVPVRYQVEAQMSPARKVNAHVRVNWLLHLVRVCVEVKDNQPHVWVRLLWFRLLDTQAKEEKAVKEVERTVEGAERDTKEAVQSAADAVEDVQKEFTEPLNEAGEEVEEELTATPLEETFQEQETVDGAAGQSQEEEPMKEPATSPVEEKEKMPWIKKIAFLYKEICGKIKGVIAIIADTKLSLEQKIAALSKKWERLQGLWRDLRVQHTISLVKKQLRKLIHSLTPKKFQLRLHVGLSDVALLGQISAVMSLLYPFLGEHVLWQPDFKQEVLEGEVVLKGRVRLGSFVRVLLALGVRKDIWYTVNEVKKFAR